MDSTRQKTSKEQARQQARKLEYFTKWLDEDFFTKRYQPARMREAMIIAYKRGRGDRVEA